MTGWCRWPSWRRKRTRPRKGDALIARPSLRRAAVLLAWSLIALPGCAVPPERVLIADFFAASRLRDFTMLSRFSTTAFEPHQQGIVTTFDIESISPERSEGALLLKDVTVRAPVKTPDRGTVEKTLTVTLQRAAVPTEERPLYGGWKVSSVRD